MNYGESQGSVATVRNIPRATRSIANVGLTCAAVLGLIACGAGSTAAPPASPVAPIVPGAPVITTEADGIMHMDQLRAAGFKGAGVRVGVISTGVNFLATYQAAGVLPHELYVSQNTPGTLDEGSWMLELIHQHAPDAILGFCDGLDLDFDGCIKDLADNFHADIIVDDLLFSGQFYPDATATIIGDLEAANAQLVFIHLAGNEQQGGYWQGSFMSTQAQLGGVPITALDFGVAGGADSDAFNHVTVPAGAHLILLVNWNDPPHGDANRALSAHLLDSDQVELSHVGSQLDPNLRLDYMNSTATAKTVSLAISLDNGSGDGLAVQITQGSPTCNIECQSFTYTSAGLAGGTVGDFEDALVVGASNAHSPRALEPWSNYGPFRIDFSASPNPVSPDGFDYIRLNAPSLVRKPDLVAPDCVTVPFSNGVNLSDNQFCGTSAAVPAVAAAAALLESAGFNRVQVLKALRSTAVPLGSTPWDPGYGFGLADAYAAWKSGGR